MQEGTPLRMTEGVFFHLIHRKRSPFPSRGRLLRAKNRVRIVMQEDFVQISFICK